MKNGETMNTKKQKNKAATMLFIALVMMAFQKSYAVEREGGISVGGYGSVRFELPLADGTPSFVLRRIVPTFSATVKERLRFYTELEFERFGLIELAEELKQKEGGLLAKTGIEGTHGSEIKLEQMWGEFEISRALRFRIGGILSPVGRFNILHDDDLWEPARRPLSVRDATTLPEKTAWMELGAGFNGNFDLGGGLFGYDLYVVNGVTLEHDFEMYVIGGHEEEVDGNVIKHNHAQLEAVIKPRFGNMKLDTKKEKAITGRLFFSPAIGYEVGFSGYFGRYTPDVLVLANVWSAAFDFKAEPASFFDFEGEYSLTQFQKIDKVVEDIVKKAFYKGGKVIFYSSTTGVEVEIPAELVSEIKLKEKSLADIKHGGWILFRLKFFPSFLKGSAFDFDGESEFILFLRPEYVQYKNTILSLDFKNGVAEEIKKDGISEMRSTIGIAYRPVKTFVFSLSYEFTTLLSGSEYIHSSGNKDQHFILFGFAFGL